MQKERHPRRGLVQEMQGLSVMSTLDVGSVQRGSGPLLQRDYWAVIDGCDRSPSDVGALLAARFCELAPPELARFEPIGDVRRPLEVGDELRVTIRLAGTFGIRVTHRDACSLTFATLEGHPEIGRITFGAYRNDEGQVVFHIRSRARSSSRLRYAAWLLLGDAMQVNTWTLFVDRVASTIGTGVVGSIGEESKPIPEEALGPTDEPTYIAQGD